MKRTHNYQNKQKHQQPISNEKMFNGLSCGRIPVQGDLIPSSDLSGTENSQGSHTHKQV